MNQLIKMLYLTMNRLNQNKPGTLSPPPPPSPCLPKWLWWIVGSWVEKMGAGGRQQRGLGMGVEGRWPIRPLWVRLCLPLGGKKELQEASQEFKLALSLPPSQKKMGLVIFLIQSYCYKDFKKTIRQCIIQDNPTYSSQPLSGSCTQMW